MKKIVNFYSVIIGTELLNGRRKDAHFSFLNKELLQRGWEHKASFIIEDDTKLMYNIFKLIQSDPDSVLFCFGGIGSTPDDYTRKIAADAFTSSEMEIHNDAKILILERFADDAYPHRINMAYLPLKAKLLKNVVNNVPGFYLEKRFFFTPGFPSMSQSMVIEALEKYYPNNQNKYRLTLTASCGENDLINTMKMLPENIELSSLPKIIGDKRKVVISIASYEEKTSKKYFQLFIDYLVKHKINYVLEDLL